MSFKYIDIIIPSGDSLEELKVTINSLLSQEKFIKNIFIIVSGINKKALKNKIKKICLIQNKVLNFMFLRIIQIKILLRALGILE